MATRKTAGKVVRPPCGLCGKTGRFVRTECGGQWICDDEATDVLLSYARDSCSRNHRRFTLCGHHSVEGHGGDWRHGRWCRDDFATEIYVHFGTNEYNFVKLENPPGYTPTRCQQCRAIIRLAKDPFTMKGDACYCERCSPIP